jgi:hypothetical protein
VVWGYCILQGLPGHSVEDLHVAEVRHVYREEVISLFSTVIFVSRAVSGRRTMIS